MSDVSQNFSTDKDSKMLDEMIRRTIGNTERLQVGNEVLRRQLLQVAHAHPKEGVVSEAIGSELVHAASVSVLNVPAQLHPAWKHISEAVAQSLLNDPCAKQQLDHLWHGLRKELDQADKAGKATRELE